MEARDLDNIGQIEQARSADELENTRAMVGYVVEIMVTSPSEFARECGSWARRADPRMLAVDEFQ